MENADVWEEIDNWEDVGASLDKLEKVDQQDISALLDNWVDVGTLLDIVEKFHVDFIPLDELHILFNDPEQRDILEYYGDRILYLAIFEKYISLHIPHSGGTLDEFKKLFSTNKNITNFLLQLDLCSQKYISDAINLQKTHNACGDTFEAMMSLVWKYLDLDMKKVSDWLFSLGPVKVAFKDFMSTQKYTVNPTSANSKVFNNKFLLVNLIPLADIILGAPEVANTRSLHKKYDSLFNNFKEVRIAGIYETDGFDVALEVTKEILLSKSARNWANNIIAKDYIYDQILKRKEINFPKPLERKVLSRSRMRRNRKKSQLKKRKLIVSPKPIVKKEFILDKPKFDSTPSWKLPLADILNLVSNYEIIPSPKITKELLNIHIKDKSGHEIEIVGSSDLELKSHFANIIGITFIPNCVNNSDFSLNNSDIRGKNIYETINENFNRYGFKVETQNKQTIAFCNNKPYIIAKANSAPNLRQRTLKFLKFHGYVSE